MLFLVSVASNFIYSDIISRKHDFAMYNSLGMSEKQKKKMLNFECVYYMLKTVLISLHVLAAADIILTAVLSFAGVIRRVSYITADNQIITTGPVQSLIKSFVPLVVSLIFPAVTLYLVFAITSKAAAKKIQTKEIVPLLKDIV